MGFICNNWCTFDVITSAFNGLYLLLSAPKDWNMLHLWKGTVSGLITLDIFFFWGQLLLLNGNRIPFLPTSRKLGWTLFLFAANRAHWWLTLPVFLRHALLTSNDNLCMYSITLDYNCLYMCNHTELWGWRALFYNANAFHCLITKAPWKETCEEKKNRESMRILCIERCRQKLCVFLVCRPSTPPSLPVLVQSRYGQSGARACAHNWADLHSSPVAEAIRS